MNLKFLGAALAVVLAFLGLLALMNWERFVAPTSLFLGFGLVEVPLGIVLLSFLGAVSAIFVASILGIQGAALLDARRMAKDLKAQRDLADVAEASRFTEMRSFVDERLRALLAEQATHAQAAVAQRAQADAQLLARMEESARALAAHLGEVEDKLDRALSALRPA